MVNPEQYAQAGEIILAAQWKKPLHNYMLPRS
jgi:hypothetical protein